MAAAAPGDMLEALEGLDDGWMLDLDPLEELEELASGGEQQLSGAHSESSASGTMVNSPDGDSGLDDEGGAGGSGAGGAKGKVGGKASERRRAQNREACRRHRQRKRKEADNLRVRNDELEEKRELYLRRIAELQNEADALRFAGDVDLAKENELMRVEIKRHKAFVRRLMDITKTDMPDPLAPSEQLRLLRRGLESGMCQALGLAYASSCDPDWIACPPEEGSNLRIHFQYLPRGVDRDKAKLLNLRLDLLRLPGSVDKVRGLGRSEDTEFGSECMEMHREESNIEIELHDILPESVREASKELEDGESVELKRFVERSKIDGSVSEMVFAMATGIKQVATAALFPADLGIAVAPGQSARASVDCCSCFPEILVQAGLAPVAVPDQHRRATPTFSRGSITVPDPEDPERRSHQIVMITVAPYEEAMEVLTSDKHRFGADNRAPPALQREWDGTLRALTAELLRTAE